MDTRLELDLNTATIGDYNRDLLKLEFRFPAGPHTEDDHLIGGLVTARQSWLSLNYKFGCFGCDLVRFAESLRRLHKSLEGEACFQNLEGSVCVRFHVADVGRGFIAAQVSLQWEVQSPFSAEYSYPSLELNGFGIEQSYLRTIADQIDKFLRESGVNLADPFT